MASSARLKLARAAKHFKAIKRSIAKYAASHPYKLTKSNGEKTVKVTIRKAPPPEISILAGEMIYQMRSALDHLVFDLIKSNPGKVTLPATWEKRCEFPLRLTIPTKGNPPVPHQTPVPYSVFSETLPGISKQAFAFIESVQPYYRVGAINNSLGYLAVLSNIDKHRRLNIIGGRVRKRETIRFASGLSCGGLEMLDHGAEVPTDTGWNKGDRAVYVNRRFRALVYFKERASLGDAGALAVDYLLELILGQINAVIARISKSYLETQHILGSAP